MPKHPSYNIQDPRISKMRKNCSLALDRLEKLKNILSRLAAEHKQKKAQPVEKKIQKKEGDIDELEDILETQKREQERIEREEEERMRKIREFDQKNIEKMKSSSHTHLNKVAESEIKTTLTPITKPDQALYKDLNELIVPKPKEFPSPNIPVRSQTKRVASLENGMELRHMTVPKDLIEKFLNVAKPNTAKNIETCGLLCGTLGQDKVQITTLLIPKQEGTSDTVFTLDELEIFEFIQESGLFILGWIHVR